MIIDFHTHCFPDKIVGKAMEQLSHSSALMPALNGTVEGLLNSMEEDGIDISVVLSIATNERQQKSVNDFAASIQSDKIIAFGSVYPDAPDALDELERIKAMGMKGVKLHPEYQSFNVDDEKMKPIYKKISQLGLITVFHAGADYGYKPPWRCEPKALAKALAWFDSPVVAAHLGGAECREDTLKYLCTLPLYLDVSYSYGMMCKYHAQAIIEKHGTDKILFASDSPWHNPGLEKYLIETLDLTAEDRERIYYKNAAKLLNI